jgi:hypothetical protein
MRIQSLDASRRAPLWSAGASIDIQEADPTPYRVSAPWHWGSTVIAMAVVVACGFAWKWSSSIDGPGPRSGEPLLADASDATKAYEARLAAARVDVDSMLAASGEDDFFGVSMDDGPVSVIIEDSEAMNPYADQVARLGYAARVHTDSKNLAFSAFTTKSAQLPPNVEGDAVTADVRYFPLSYARSVERLATFDSSAASLTDAVALTNNSPARKLFIVLARALPEDELAALTTAIQDRGIETHVISLGAATVADYAPVAVAGNGWTLPVSDASLASLVDRCKVEMPIPSK